MEFRNLTDELLKILSLFQAENFDYAICGGVAVAIHGAPRYTKNIDFLILRNDLDRALKIVEKLGYILPSGIIPFHVGKPTEHHVFRISKAIGEELFTLDFLLVSDYYQDVWETRRDYSFGEQTVRTVSLDGLIKMKTLAGRPNDLIDIQTLRNLNQT